MIFNAVYDSSVVQIVFSFFAWQPPRLDESPCWKLQLTFIGSGMDISHFLFPELFGKTER